MTAIKILDKEVLIVHLLQYYKVSFSWALSPVLRVCDLIRLNPAC